jgi:2-keto-4-pentenoate hydratase/2-oxohepta-3-ene-1,7-dioic acid hydratase in catechol pathway
MKLIRFDLRHDPGNVRSGIIQSGKVYETDGSAGVATHDVSEVRPLAPVKGAASLRIFDTRFQPDLFERTPEESPRYHYGNSANIFGPNQSIPFPYAATQLVAVPYLVGISLGDGFRAEPTETDGLLLGITVGLGLFDGPSVERARASGLAYGGQMDFGFALGPAITTPDELDDYLVSEDYGRAYGLQCRIKLNGVEVASGSTETLPYTLAQAIAGASQSAPVRTTDLFAIGPVIDPLQLPNLGPGDEVTAIIETVGALSTRIGD